MRASRFNSESRAPDAAQRAARAAWCAAEPGSIVVADRKRGSRFCGAALHAAPRPGTPDARCTRSLVCTCSGRTHTSNNEYPGIHPALPHAMVLAVSFALSPVTGSFATVVHGLTLCLSPVGPT